MSNAQIGNLPGFVDKRQSPAAEAGSTTDSLADAQDYADRGTMQGILIADGRTAEEVRSLTQNDLVFAVRALNDAGSL
jgi:hypothetical protein